MSSPEQKNSWRAYHEKHAHLRMLTKEANLKLGAGGPKPKPPESS